ncbi:MAG: hypothetical protein VX563_04565 [Planctomycetota bacterium]|nr:hypothetical protein [Planctomycetota bacterium]
MRGERLDKPTVADLLNEESTVAPPPEPPRPNDEETDPGLGGMMPHPA